MNKREFNKALALELSFLKVPRNAIYVQNDGKLEGVSVRKENLVNASINRNVVTIEWTTPQGVKRDVIDWNKAFTPNMIVLTADKFVEVLR